MATYKEIKGTQIEAVATDPSNPVEGQVWYNTTSNVLKGSTRTSAGAWTTTTAMSTTRWGGAASSVSPSSSAIMATGASTVSDVNTESWNGSSWTELNNVNEGRYGVWGTGTTTSMIFFGGNDPGASPTASGDRASTELWNGTNWTEVNNMNSVKRYPGGAGADSTASLSFGSFNGTVKIANTETWNGTNWTEVNDLNTAKSSIAGVGATYTAALCVGGNVGNSPNVNGSGETELWNGTNWTEVNDLNTARRDLGGAGTNTLGLVFGGLKPPNSWYGVTESWNGTNWTEDGDLNTAREITGQASGTQTAALACGGLNAPGTYLNPVEEFTGAGASVTRTFTDS